MKSTDLICSNFKKPNVAICVSGLTRTFALELVYKSFKENLVDSFGANIKLFGFLKYNDKRGDTRNGKNGVHKNYDIDEAVKYCQFDILKIEDSNNLTIPDNCNYKEFSEDMNVHENREHYKSIFSQLYNRHVSYNQILEYEKNNNIKFDYIIFTRPDIGFILPIKPFIFWDLNRTYHVWDHVFFFPRTEAYQILSKAYEDILIGNDLVKPGISAEKIFYNNYMKNKIDLTKKLPFIIIRLKGMHDTPESWNNKTLINDSGKDLFADITYNNSSLY